ALVPYIVVSYAGDGCVVQLSFASKLGLREGCHANDVAAELPVDAGFSFGREERPFDTYIGAATVRLKTVQALHRLPEQCAQMRAERLGKRDMCDDAALKKTVGATLGAIKDLIGHNKIERSVVLAQTADGADGDNPLNA